MSAANTNLLDTTIRRLKNSLFGLDPTDPTYKERFNKAFMVDPATQSLWDNAQRYASLTDEQKQAALLRDGQVKSTLRGAELDQNIDHQLKAADVAAKISANNTVQRGVRTGQDTDAFLTRNQGLTQSQADLIRAQGEQQLALQNSLIQGVVPAVLAHEKELAGAERNQNVMSMLGRLATGGLMFALA